MADSKVWELSRGSPVSSLSNTDFSKTDWSDWGPPATWKADNQILDSKYSRNGSKERNEYL
jgi:hypothetical protein